VRRLADLDRGQAFVAGDAVFGVDDQITRTQRRQLGQEGVGALAALLVAHQAVAEYVLFCEDGDLSAGEAMVERQHHERGIGLGGQRLLPGPDLPYRLEPMVLEQAGQSLASSGAIAGQDNLLIAFP
jgi:hypothetical protein